MTDSYEIIINDEQGFFVFDALLERWQATPRQFPFDQRGAVVPQTLIPASLRKKRRKLHNFYFFTCLYMRGGIESIQAFRSLLRMYRDHPRLFDPNYVYHRKLFPEEIQPIIAKYIGWDSKAVARFWVENSKRLAMYWDGDANNLLRGATSFDEAMRRIQNKKTKHERAIADAVDGRGQGFMGFQAKMVSMFIYFIDWEGLLESPFIYPTPADFHNFRIALAHRILVLMPQPENLRSTERISKPWRELTVRYLEARRGLVTPVELADAIWLFSLVACGNSPLTDYHERKDRNGNGMFEPNYLPHSEQPAFLAPKFRSRLIRTCLACPLIDSCELAIPAGPYYQRRGDRAVAFGGQLYLWNRFPIESHLPTFLVDYLGSKDVADEGAHSDMFSTLPVQSRPEKSLDFTRIGDHEP